MSTAKTLKITSLKNLYIYSNDVVDVGSIKDMATDHITLGNTSSLCTYQPTIQCMVHLTLYKFSTHSLTTVHVTCTVVTAATDDNHLSHGLLPYSSEFP